MSTSNIIVICFLVLPAKCFINVNNSDCQSTFEISQECSAASSADSALYVSNLINSVENYCNQHEIWNPANLYHGNFLNPSMAISKLNISDVVYYRRAMISFIPFFLLFKDLNNIIFKYDEIDTPLKMFISNHCSEDGHHYKMFLHDLKALGLDGNHKYSKVLMEIFDDGKTLGQRSAFYNIIRLDTKIDGPNNDVGRAIILHAVECMATKHLSGFMSYYEAFFANTGITLQYLAPVHLHIEQHTYDKAYEFENNRLHFSFEKDFLNIKLQDENQFDLYFDIAKNTIDTLAKSLISEISEFIKQDWEMSMFADLLV